MSVPAAASTSRDTWHTVNLRIPFFNPAHAKVAKRALEVDREQNAVFVDRSVVTDDNLLIVTFHAATIRLLRLAANSFLSSVDLVMQTMESFAPDPSVPPPTDQQLEDQSRIANRGDVKGIELRGDGRGAGSGEEIR